MGEGKRRAVVCFSTKCLFGDTKIVKLPTNILLSMLPCPTKANALYRNYTDIFTAEFTDLQEAGEGVKG